MLRPNQNLFPSALGKELSSSFTIIVEIPFASHLIPSSLYPISLSFFILVEIISIWDSWYKGHMKDENFKILHVWKCTHFTFMLVW